MSAQPNSLPIPATPPRRRAGGFWHLLIGGLRALLFLPPKPGTISTLAIHCAVLVLLITLIGIVAEHWLLGASEYIFNWTTLREAWFDLPILLLTGAWMAQVRQTGLTQPTPLFHFAMVMVSASVWIVTIAYGLFAALMLGWLPGGENDTVVDSIYYGAPLWSFLVAIATIRSMHRYSPIPVLRRIVVLLVLATITAWYLLVPAQSYWQVPEGAEPELYAGLARPGAARQP